MFRLEGSNSGTIYACLSSNVWTAQNMPAPQSGTNGSVLVTTGTNSAWTALGGDVSGAIGNVSVNALRNRSVASTVPQSGQALIWDGSNWTPQFLNGLGQGAVTIKNGATTVSTSAVANFIAGEGMIISLLNVSGENRIQHNADTTVLETRVRSQSGEALRCNSSSASATAYTCNLNPVLNSYPTGLVLNWWPDVAGAGGATTLKVGPLAAIPVKLADGVTNPASYDIEANKLYTIWFDGTNFRLPDREGAFTFKSGATTINNAISTNYLAGTGITVDLTQVGGESRVQHNADTTVLETRIRAQSGEALRCNSSSASATAYTCNLTPTLTSYESGLVLNWWPDIAATGGATTLKIGTLAAIPVKLADGVTNPTAYDVEANRLYTIWFDGTNFRLPARAALSATGAVSRPACAVDLRGRIWHSFGTTNQADTVAVCAKGSDNLYAWRTIY